MKISKYTPAPSPQLSDKLIGTDVSGDDNTYNFTITDILTLGQTMYAPNDYISCFDTTTQSCITDGIKAVEYDTTLLYNNISIASGTQITFLATGVYNIQLSARPEMASGSNDVIAFWLRLNGVDVSNSARTFHLAATTDVDTRTVIFPLVSVQDTDYVEIMWTQNGNIDLTPDVENLVIPYPAAPSVVLNVTRVY